MYRRLLPFGFMLLVIVLGLILAQPKQLQIPTKPGQIRYVALGDSYTYGQGVIREQSWPYLLTADLNQHGVPVVLVGNIAESSWTTQQVIDYQLPLAKTLKPDFMTLLIGTNDWVQKVDPETFRQRFGYLLDQLKPLVPNGRLVVIGLPDYPASPIGLSIELDKEVSTDIAVFNQVISEETSKRQLPLVDLYQVSQAMRANKALVAQDGVHPSAEEYAIWEQTIYPVAYQALQ